MNISEKLTQIAENQQKVYDAGIEAGKQAEYDAFWDTYQDNGNKTDYSYAFSGTGWNKLTFKPKYDLIVTSGSYMFSSWRTNAPNYIENLAETLAELGVVLDTSQCTVFGNFFRYGSTKVVPTLDTRAASNLNTMSVNTSISTIEKIILRDDGSQTVDTMFQASHASLKNIVFEGVIGSSINMSTCPVLSVESMKNIISCLKNYKGTDKEFTYQIKFPSDRWAALEADSTAPDGNKWADYVNSLGWST